MTALVWDQVGEHFYQTGIDRGVLYLHDGRAVAWNGLTGVEENTSSEVKSYHLDGVKYLDVLSPGDFSGKLKAFTYPDEFDSVNGIVDVASGLSYHDQPSKSFDLSYRTRLGNDVDGVEYGYKIHILYNVIANPDPNLFGTIKDSGDAVEFGWALIGTPPRLSGFRPTVHVSIDSTKTPSNILQTIEKTLYGTNIADPHLPSIQDLTEYFGGS